jgi:hypothetical protein
MSESPINSDAHAAGRARQRPEGLAGFARRLVKMGPAGKPEQIQRLKHLNGAFSRHNPLKERGMAEKLVESKPYGNLKQPHEGELGAESNKNYVASRPGRTGKYSVPAWQT